MVVQPLQSVFASEPNLAFIFFIAFSLMLALGVRFGLYAYWNMQATDLNSQAVLWEFLLFVGSTAALYGLLGVLEAATAVTQMSVVATPYRDGVFLAFLLLLALTMREIYDNDALTNAPGDSDGGFEHRRSVEMGFAVVVAGSVFGSGIVGNHVVLTAIEGVAATVFASYGLMYGREQLSRSSVQGTMIDSLLRHLLPVVAFGLLVLVVDLTMLVGLNVVIVRHIQVVFVIMTATTLMSATIKLRQHIAWF
ncbi:hypothetical protein ACFR9U_18515 [Halorientalis brevis]|uniref:Uncharacterized protein n=1 Tax=Halorientalis brevis TaxID=1126241 RepID=A0ABD6CF94_9EURY|nr:hypothetical protein [Halorientalis brevis]